ncbi:hypothetical protein SCHPADRAFT_947684 [Schizopora paradoxa]|uniref:Uncharacterized protein n=1 Tax=Schizopora paradoxa TaxID=27342 RepID=A0A0H2R4T7_9AGAM|nr:hypothetical protein SCHPADRAFT_947684 [Schizopora paradoxa]
MKAFEEGLANVRDATKQADHADRREIRKPRGRVKDSVPTTQVPNNAPRLNGDGVGAGEFGHAGESDSDSDSFPKLRKKQRRATGKRASITNTFHKEIRQFLELHGLFPPKDNPNFTPPSVSEAVLARFRAEGKTAGPKFGDPKAPLRLNWSASLKFDTWNVASIDLLAHQLHKIFTGRKDKDDFKDLPTDIVSLRKNIVDRLTPIKTRICKSQEEEKEHKDRAHQRMRRASRRKNRNTTRYKITKYQQKKHKNDKTSVWSDILVVLDILNGNGRDTADGISEDESDVDEKGRRIKRAVRILRRDWINKDIPKLLHAVDTYAQDSLDDYGRLPQGNTGHKREPISKNADKRQFMTGLPRNFYDDKWYRNLDETEKSLVLAEDRVVVIPTLAPYTRSFTEVVDDAPTDTIASPSAQ